MTLDEMNAAYGQIKKPVCRTCAGDVIDIRTVEVTNARPNMTPLPNDEILPPDVFIGMDEFGFGCYMRMVNGVPTQLVD